MHINLKQPEIINALAGYLANQGINLQNKSLTVTFTAGRKKSGLSADIDIEQSELPDFVSDVFEQEQALIDKPCLSLVSSTESKPDPVPEETPEEEEEPAVEKPVRTASLFN